MPRLPFRVFNLAGFSLFFFWLLNVVFSESIHINWVKHFFPIQICDSCSTSRHDFLNDKRPRPPWLYLPSWIKSLISKHLKDQVSFLKVSCFHFLVKCPSNLFLVPLCMILCPSPLLIYQNQLFISCLNPILF